MSMTQPSPLFRLVEAQLGGSLLEFIADRRLPTKTWQEIADEIKERTGEQVSREWLRKIYAENDAPAGSAAA